MSNTLSALPKLAADYIRVHGWTQGEMVSETGKVCLTGALRECTPVPGDDILAREVLRRKGRGEGWNDNPLRNEIEVTGYLDRVEITDADLEDTYGSQWRKIVTLVRQAAAITNDQREMLYFFKVHLSPAYRSAAQTADRLVGRRGSRYAGIHAIAAFSHILGIARLPAHGAAIALTTSESVGSNGLEQHHIDTLLHPWESVMGTIEETGS